MNVEFATLGNAIDFGDITVAEEIQGVSHHQQEDLVRVGLEVPLELLPLMWSQLHQKEMQLNLVILSQTKNMGNNGFQVLLEDYLLEEKKSSYTTNMIDYITIASNGNAILCLEN